MLGFFKSLALRMEQKLRKRCWGAVPSDSVTCMRGLLCTQKPDFLTLGTEYHAESEQREGEREIAGGQAGGRAGGREGGREGSKGASEKSGRRQKVQSSSRLLYLIWRGSKTGLKWEPHFDREACCRGSIPWMPLDHSPLRGLGSLFGFGPF